LTNVKQDENKEGPRNNDNYLRIPSKDYIFCENSTYWYNECLTNIKKDETKEGPRNNDNYLRIPSKDYIFCYNVHTGIAFEVWMTNDSYVNQPGCVEIVCSELDQPIVLDENRGLIDVVKSTGTLAVDPMRCPSGIKHGTWTYYDHDHFRETGEVFVNSIGNFNSGQKHGEFTYYYHEIKVKDQEGPFVTFTWFHQGMELQTYDVFQYIITTLRPHLTSLVSQEIKKITDIVISYMASCSLTIDQIEQTLKIDQLDQLAHLF